MPLGQYGLRMNERTIAPATSVPPTVSLGTGIGVRPYARTHVPGVRDVPEEVGSGTGPERAPKGRGHPRRWHWAKPTGTGSDWGKLEAMLAPKNSGQGLGMGIKTRCQSQSNGKLVPSSFLGKPSGRVIRCYPRMPKGWEGT